MKVIEVILHKSVAAFYARFRAVSLWPRADVTSLITVGSVCSQWCNIVNGSKRSRRKIRNLFNKTQVMFNISFYLGQ
jgi:hypothetical protein